MEDLVNGQSMEPLRKRISWWIMTSGSMGPLGDLLEINSRPDFLNEKPQYYLPSHQLPPTATVNCSC